MLMPDLFVQAMTAMGFGIAAYFGGTFAHYLQKRRAHREEPIDIVNARDLELQALLATLGTKLGAIRVSVARLHNGEHFVGDQGIVKLSRCYEWAADGRSYQRREWQNVLVSEIPEEVKLALEPGPSWRAVREIPIGRFWSIMSAGDVSAVARVAIVAGDKKLGILGADFSSEIKPVNLDLLTEYAFRVGRLLTNQKPVA